MDLLEIAQDWRRRVGVAQRLAARPRFFAKLNPALVVAIRSAAAAGESQRSLARKYGVDHGTIAAALHGQTWRNVEAADRECEGCGQRKPVDEMSTVSLPGTGESYQCEQCRGVRRIEAGESARRMP